MTDTKHMVETAVQALEDKKAGDIKVIDISEISSIADYFVIADGSNVNQIQAMADNVEEKLAKKGCNPKQIEGRSSANWILLDYTDVVIHIFDNESRAYYDLERIWRDGRFVDIGAI